MAATESSKTSVASMSSSVHRVSDRRPSLDDISPDLKTRTDRYLNATMSDIAPEKVENGSPEDELTALKVTKLTNSDDEDNHDDSYINENDSFSLDLLQGETEDEYLYRLETQKLIIESNRNLKSRSRSRLRKSRTLKNTKDTQNKDMLKFFDDYEREVKNLKGQLQVFHSKNTEQESNLRLYETQINSLYTELETRNKELEDLHEITATTMAERDSVKASYINHEHEKQVLKDKIKEHESSERRLEQKVSSLSVDINSLKLNLNDITTEKASLQDQVVSLNNKTTELLGNLEENLRLRDESTKAVADKKSIEIQLVEQKSIIEEKSAQLSELNNVIDSLKDDLKVTKNDKDKTVTNMTKDIQLLDHQIEKMKLELKNSVTSNSKLNEELSLVNSKLAAASERVYKLESSRDKLESKIKLLEQANEGLSMGIYNKKRNVETAKSVSFEVEADKNKNDTEDNLLEKIKLLEKTNLDLIMKVRGKREEQANFDKTVARLLKKQKRGQSSITSIYSITLYISAFIFLYACLNLFMSGQMYDQSVSSLT